MDKTFYSNGKLLITGEYLVLDGAKSLALPTRYGQNLIVKKGKPSKIIWESFDSDASCWFKAKITFDQIKFNAILENTDNVKTTLIEILHQAYLLNPDFLNKEEGYHITTKLSFPRLWGLGTSSTLINNIAQWTQVNAFTLLNNSFGGSGYDIACAQNNTPVLYQLINKKVVVKPILFHPEFHTAIYFVYLNQKQNSKTAIAAYYKKQNDIAKLKKHIDSITQQIISTNDINVFIAAIEKHETLLHNILEQKTIKESLFSDFDGTIKSLGAWGGDFIMVISKNSPVDYFKELGYTTILKYEEMILS